MFAAAEAEEYDYPEDEEGASDSGFFFPDDEDTGPSSLVPLEPQGPPNPQRPPLRDKPGQLSEHVFLTIELNRQYIRCTNCTHRKPDSRIT